MMNFIKFILRPILWRWREFWLYVRVQKFITRLLGVRFKRPLRRIEIDITYQCNLKCPACDRSCSQAPTQECMSLDQIQAFVEESTQRNISWEHIRVLGGEPTLHPELAGILQKLIDYKQRVSPQTEIVLVTNGVGEACRKILEKIPKEIRIENSQKDVRPIRHVAFNDAPVDDPWYRFADFRNGCETNMNCGIGLCATGYYCCACAGAMDRILGLDNGRKGIPRDEDAMTDQLLCYCRYCGGFKASSVWRFVSSSKEKVSAFWKKAYEAYVQKKPRRTLYGTNDATLSEQGRQD